MKIFGGQLSKLAINSRGNKCPPPPNEALFVEGQSETTPSIRVCNLLAGFLVMDSGGPQLGQVYS